MNLEMAKLRAAVGFILTSNGKMFTGTGQTEDSNSHGADFVRWPSLEPMTFTAEDEAADWSEL